MFSTPWFMAIRTALVRSWTDGHGPRRRRERRATWRVARQVEWLEDRTQLSVTTNFAAGVLTISSDGADAMAVASNASNEVTINGNPFNPGSGNLLASAVTSLSVTGGSGNNDISVSGLTLTGALTLNGGGGNDSATLSNVSVTGSATDGLNASNFSSVNVSNSQFNNNTGEGIELTNAGAVEFTSVTATGNDPGTLINGATSFSDTDGNFSNNDDHGIQLIDISGNVTLIRTTADNNDADNDGIGDGLNATDGGDADTVAIGGNLLVQGARFRDSGGANDHQENGVFVASITGSATFQTVEAFGNEGDGVRIDAGGTGVTITNGVYAGNGANGIEVGQSGTGTGTLFDIGAANGNQGDGARIGVTGPVASVVVTGGWFGGNLDDGIDLNDITGSATLTNVLVNFSGSGNDATGHGLEADSVVTLTIDGCTFGDNRGDGINGEASTTINVTNVTFLPNVFGLGGSFTTVGTLNFTPGTGTSADVVTLTSTQIQPMGQQPSAYATVTRLNINTGDGADTIIVKSTIVEPSVITSFINAGNGTDTIRIDAPGLTVQVGPNGEGDDDTIEVLAGSTLQGVIGIRNGDTLKGNGTVKGLLIVEPGAHLSPGSSPGTITVNGFLALIGGANFDIEINGAAAGTQFDQLVVTGAGSTISNMHGTVLNATRLASFLPAAGTQFTIIDNQGSDPIPGTFSGLPDNATFPIGGVNFRIDYDGGTGNDVVLTEATVVQQTRFLRMYNRFRNAHFFTTSMGEYNALKMRGYEDEASGRFGFNVVANAAAGTLPIHRLYNLAPISGGQHYFTLNDAERDFLVARGWRFEKEEGFIFPTQQPGTVEILHLYNTASGGHLFTENTGTRDFVLRIPGWEQQTRLGFGFAAALFSAGGTASARTALSHAIVAADVVVGRRSESERLNLRASGSTGDFGRPIDAGGLASRLTLESAVRETLPMPQVASLSERGLPRLATMLDSNEPTLSLAPTVVDRFWSEFGSEFLRDVFEVWGQ